MHAYLTKVLITWLLTFSMYVFAQSDAQINQELSNLNALSYIGFVLPSSNYQQTAFTYVHASKDNKTWQKNLYIKTADQLKLISNNFNSTDVQWSPDGKQLIYLDKGKTSQSLWSLPINGQPAKILLELNNKSINSFKYSHDGKKIAFVAEEQLPTNKAVIDFSKRNNNRIYVIDSKLNEASKPIAITPSNVNVYIYNSAYDSGFDWSPDDKNIVYAYNKLDNLSESEQFLLAVVNLDAKSHQTIPYTHQHSSTQPFYSPNGKLIAFRTNLEFNPKINLQNAHDLNSRICVVETESFRAHCLNNTPNELPSLLGWNKKGSAVIVSDNYKMNGPKLYALPVAENVRVQDLSIWTGYMDFISLRYNTESETVGFGYETTYEPPEAYMIQLSKNNQLLKISSLNKVENKRLGKIERVHWQSHDNKEIEGLLLLPENYDNKRQYPLLLMVHGGPVDAWSNQYIGGCWRYADTVLPMCWQHYLNKDFVIFQPNPRGSNGYGLDFRLANYADFGGGDFQDIMLGVDHLISKKIVDPTNMVVFGWSYGGYMTQWIVSQTDRFKSAVAGAGMSDLISFYGTSDIPLYLNYFLGGAYWNEFNLYKSRSPLFHAEKIKTPIMLIAGDKDLRVPMSQSQELYTRLRLQNKMVKFIVLKNQKHLIDDLQVFSESFHEVSHWLTTNITNSYDHGD